MKMRSLLLAGAVMISACSGGGGRSAPVPQTQSAGAGTHGASVQANIVVRIPSRPANTAANAKPKYISPDTESVKISVNNGTPAVIALTPTSPGCVAASGTTPLTCTASVAAPAGMDTFTATFYDDTQALGDKLSSGTTTVNIVSGQLNTVQIATSGIVGQLQIGIVPRFINPGAARTIPLTVYVNDIDGWQIMGPQPFNEIVTVTDTDASGFTSLCLNPANNACAASGSSVQLTYPSDTVSLVYNGMGVANATLKATTPSGIASQTNTFSANQNVYVLNIQQGCCFQVSAFPISAAAGAPPASSYTYSGYSNIAAYTLAADSTGNTYLSLTGSGQHPSGIGEFPHNASGAWTPYPVWTGSNGAIAVDGSGNVYSLTASGNETDYMGVVNVYNPSSLTTPFRSFTFGPLAGFDTVLDIAADSAGNTYILDTFDEAANEVWTELRVYPATASGTNPPLTADIQGSNTLLEDVTNNLYEAQSIAVDPAGQNICVPVNHDRTGVSQTLVYSVAAATSNGNLAPARILTPAGGAFKCAFDWQGNIYVSDTSSNPARAQIDVYGLADTTPSRTIGGTSVLYAPTAISIGP